MRKFRALLAGVGFLLLIGSCGALELDVIPFAQFAVQAAIGLILFGQIAIKRC